MRRPAMQRPIMDPTFLDDLAAAAAGQREPGWRVALSHVGLALRWIGRKLLSPPTQLHRRRAVYDDYTPVGRVLRGVAYRLLFVPVFLILTSMALVFAGTHPRAIASSEDPTTHG